MRYLGEVVFGEEIFYVFVLFSPMFMKMFFQNLSRRLNLLNKKNDAVFKHYW